VADHTAAFRPVDAIDVIDGLGGSGRQGVDPPVSAQPIAALVIVELDLRDP
jgi:hypothetical protein